ncbi:MAG TPA: hypothetical protein VF269_00055 [Rhodanobacteraceae bacterium]
MSEETPTPPPRKRWHWLKRDGIDLGDAVVQFIAMVAGILLALFINNLVTRRQQQHAVDEAMHAIRAELVANRAALHKSVAYLYQRTRQMLDSPKNQHQSPRPCYLWDQWGGTGAINLTDAAYQTAISTQALAHMPFRQAQQVAMAYGVQKIADKSFYLIRANILVAGPHPLSLCASAVESFAANERHLATAYTPVIGPDQTPWPTKPPNPLQSKADAGR